MADQASYVASEAVIGQERAGSAAVYPVEIDYSAPLAERFAACGGSYYRHDHFTSRPFTDRPTSTREARVNLELLHLAKPLWTKEALAEIDRLGYRPATFEELLAFGARYPEIQLQFRVVALGSYRLMCGPEYPYLSHADCPPTARTIDMEYLGIHKWHAGHRFLVVRK